MSRLKFDWDGYRKEEEEVLATRLNEHVEVIVKTEHDTCRLQFRADDIRSILRAWKELGQDVRKYLSRQAPDVVVTSIMLRFPSLIKWPAKEVMIYIGILALRVDAVSELMKGRPRELARMCQLTNCVDPLSLWIREVNQGAMEHDILNCVAKLINYCWESHHNLVNKVVLDVAHAYHPLNQEWMATREHRELERHFATSASIHWHDLRAIGRKYGYLSRAPRVDQDQDWPSPQN